MTLLMTLNRILRPRFPFRRSRHPRSIGALHGRSSFFVYVQYPLSLIILCSTFYSGLFYIVLNPILSCLDVFPILYLQ